jgi:CpeT/CpcT family (DUF1001)
MGEGGAMRAGKKGRAVAALATALCMLCGCTTDEKVHQGELTQLLAVLPGTYDNTAQAEAEAHSGVRPGHDAVALSITHVFTPRLGHYVYYAQETAADDPRRVLSQKMLSFEVDPKRGIVETIYEFVEPLRWRDGQKNKDLFTGLVVEDVQVEGCQLLWKHKADGFVATHDPKVCPDAGAGTPKPQAEMSGGALTIGDYKFRKAH